jgi:histidinol dehydrogenase
MEIIRYKDADFAKKIESLAKRDAFPKEIVEPIKNILDDIKHHGNPAIIEYAKKFDGAQLDIANIRVSDAEINDAYNKIDTFTKDTVKTAINNVTEFAKKQLPKNWTFSPRHGVTLGEKFEPLRRIGAYIPGGTAPLVSTVIHTVAIAKAAGVKEIVAITPPGKDTCVTPELLYAMKEAGATEIYRLGGVYGIGAIAYGTETINKVEKIVGPGNAYVTAAKKHVYGEVAIDMIAGPSEIMVIADKSNNPDFIAADILSQAEHGSGHERAVLVTNSAKLIAQVKTSIEQQAAKLSRTIPIQTVIANGIFLIEVENIEQAIEIANNYAPEHLEIMCTDANVLATKAKAAGAIFIGEYTPEPIGDFVAGPSHVLPTGGSARYFSGLTVSSFFRRISLIKYNKQSLKKEMPAIEKFASMEGLDAHRNSALIRFNKYTKS